MTLTIGLYVFDGVEALDFAGPFEVFTTAARMHARARPQAPALMRVCTLGRTPAPVRARAGLEIRPDRAIDDHPPLDVLIVPGGVVIDELEKADVVKWIARQRGVVPIVASVCTGAFLLARAGLADGCVRRPTGKMSRSCARSSRAWRSSKACVGSTRARS